MTPGLNMTPVPRRNPFAVTVIVGLVAFYWAAALFPTPARLLSNHGHGFQLAGASEILAGHHPFLTFKDIVYGPGMFYASAMAQRLAGGRVGGELVLVCLSYAIGYALLFRLMMGCAIAVRPALALTLVAIVAMPEPFRYYLFLLPMLFFTAAWRYAATPDCWRIGGMALAVTGAGLFRSDLGVFAYLAGVAGIAMAAGSSRRVGWHVLTFTGTILLGATPWLVWLAAHGKLLEYLTLSSIDALQDAAGRAKPAPWFDFSAAILSGENAKAWLFRLPVLTLVFAAIMLWIRRAELHGAVRTRLWIAGVFAVLSLAQASHIVDWIHVRDTLPVRFLLLAWAASAAAVPVALGAAGHRVRRMAQGFVGVVCLSAVAGAVVREDLTEVSPRAVAQKFAAYHRTRDEVLAAVRASGANFRAELYEYVRDHSSPDEGVFAVLEAPQLNYFANRRFAGAQMAIFPGYFGSAEEQRRLIAELRHEKTAFVVIDHLAMMDNAAISLERFAPEFFAFLQQEFVEVTQIGYCRVLAPRGRRPVVAGEKVQR